MISISDTLRPEHIRLGLTAATSAEAIREIAQLLRTADSVLDWQELYESLVKSAPCITESDGPFAICLPHARTDAVTAMVMSAGISAAGIRFEGCAQPVRYLFCIGVPQAMASDYLRIVGSLARLLKDPRAESALISAATPQAVLHALADLESRL